MYMRNLAGRTLANPLRLIIPLILVVLAGPAFNASGQTLTTLHQFGGFPGDGDAPADALVQGRDGYLYGTACGGGTNGDGCIFKISTNGVLTIPYSFTGSLDGGSPLGGLVQGSDGNFYGTTQYGGTNNVGTVFKVTTNGTLTTLHSFIGAPVDGAWPEAGLVQGGDGYFYGTTYYGGTDTSCANSGCGTVFKISTNGALTTLYSFLGGDDGQRTQATLVQGTDGWLYGVTVAGGTNGYGTVFKISSDGLLTTLYSFLGTPVDGEFPQTGVVQGSDGNFYGTTLLGGTNGHGTVFRMNTNGALATLYHFAGGTDGDEIYGGLVQGSDGNFYGTSYLGGSTYLYGTVFKITPTGSLTNLYSFTGGKDGGSPKSGLVQASDGNFYGTTFWGGTNNAGVVFKITVPLAPPPWPINQITGVQPSGNDIVFNVVSIACETYQLQFSNSMNPTNWVNVPGVSVTNSIGALLTLTNFGGVTGPQGFYRFAITP
ncbi:MAG: choice-of-anchor tandem repeat GloVer-containing protein [Verrucomicrobiia bacterium]|jgi:uncharacterized repeat protein (TIGR03803 family)